MCYLRQHIVSANHIFNFAGKKLYIDALINGEDGDMQWKPVLSNERGRLAQDNEAGVQLTEIIKFVTFDTIPLENKVTYALFFCDYQLLKDEKWIRLVVGGDKLDFFPTQNLQPQT